MVQGYPAWLCALTAEAPRDADMWARCQQVGSLPLAGRVVFTCVDSGIQINMDGRGREPDQGFVGRLWRTVTHEEGYVKEHIPRSLRRNGLPVKRIDGTLLMRHQHLAGSPVELLEGAETVPRANGILPPPPEAFDVIPTVSPLMIP